MADSSTTNRNWYIVFLILIKPQIHRGLAQEMQRSVRAPTVFRRQLNLEKNGKQCGCDQCVLDNVSTLPSEGLKKTNKHTKKKNNGRWDFCLVRLLNRLWKKCAAPDLNAHCPWLMSNRLSIVYTDNSHPCVNISECVLVSPACRPTPPVFKPGWREAGRACVRFYLSGRHGAPCLFCGINARPCPRLICRSCCIFAFILICASPLGRLSICPSRCSNLIVSVHYRWASNKVDTHTRAHTHCRDLRVPLETTPKSHTPQTLNICSIFNV